MTTEHHWKQIYSGSDVERCLNCPMQRRAASPSWTPNSREWQHRLSSDALEWVNGPGPECDSAERLGTEQLEAELKELSDRIAADPLRFQQVREELARRHAAGNDQPAQDTLEQRAEKQRAAGRDLQNNLVVKITAMEAEQAKLVIEAEIAKAQRDEAERRLALLVKTGTVIPAAIADELKDAITDVSMRSMLEKHAGPERARTPMTRDDATVLAIEHKYKKGTAVGSVDEWVVDAIVEASK